MNSVNPVPPNHPASPSAGDDKLRQAAEDFESVFVEQLVRQLWQSTQALSSKKQSWLSSSYQEMFLGAIAHSVASGSNLGIADALYNEFGGHSAAAASAKPDSSAAAPAAPISLHQASLLPLHRSALQPLRNAADPLPLHPSAKPADH